MHSVYLILLINKHKHSVTILIGNALARLWWIRQQHAECSCVRLNLQAKNTKKEEMIAEK